MGSVRFSQLAVLFRLLRTQMTTISAVTHLAASLLCARFSMLIFVRVWLFVLLTQFSTHCLGEYYDRRSDMLNHRPSPFTGGSRQLAKRVISARAVLRLACALALLSFSAAVTLVPSRARALALLIWLLACAYSAPPFSFNHRALGELVATLITSVLLPMLSVRAQQASLPSTPLFLQLLLAPTCIKFALFLVLNLADRRADFAARKITLALVLGPKRTARAVLLANVLAYAAALAVGALDATRAGWHAALRLLAMMSASLPCAVYICAFVLRCPYRLDACLRACLMHGTLLVWAVLLESALRCGAFGDARALPLCLLAWRCFGALVRANARALLQWLLQRANLCTTVNSSGCVPRRHRRATSSSLSS